MKGRYVMALGRLPRLRAGLILDREKPVLFLSQCNGYYTALDDNKSIFVAPNPALPILLGQIQDATAAQALVGKVNNAGAARDAKFAILVTSLESERTMVQGLCDASPELAPTIIAAARMRPLATPGHPKPLLAAINGMPSGTVLLDANASLLDGTHRRKTFNWRYTTNGGTSYTTMPSTPTGKTSISGLTPLTLVGFEVSVTVNKMPMGPWSHTVNVLVR